LQKEVNKNILIIGGIVIVVLIIVVIVTFALSKNGGTNNNNNNNGSTDKITLQYWSLWEPASVMEPIIQKYEQMNSNINIEYTQKPFTQYELNSFTRLEQGTTVNTPAPDILKISNTWLPKYQSYLSPLPSSVMSSSEYSQLFYPTVTEDFTGSDGKIYAMPEGIDGLAVFYNKTLLKKAGYDEPPKDWDTFIEAAKKLTKKDSNGRITQAGVAIGSSNNVKHSTEILNLMLLQNGIEVVNSDGTSVTLSGSRTQSTLSYYTAFVTDHKVWSADLRSDLEMFYSGNLAMMFAPSWAAFDIITSAPKVEFGIAAVPQIGSNYGTSNAVNYSMYWGDAVSKESANTTEAWKFVKYLSEQQQLRTFYQASSEIRAFGQMYPRPDMASELSTNTYLAPFVQMAPTYKSWKMGDETYVEELLRTAINDVVVNKIQPSVALKTAETAINTRYKTYGVK
jgi:multiple sugar transport system substrate-binding protein